jgi:hypothetical protein
MQSTAIVLVVVATFGLCSHAYFLDYEDDYAQTPAQDKVSISTTFYKQPFHLKVFSAAFMSPGGGKEIGTKAARKMLVKFTKGFRRTSQI